MAKDRTIKERLTAVEVKINGLDEKLDDVRTFGMEVSAHTKELTELQRQQNGMLSESLGKIRRHLKDHEEDSCYWTVQQYIANQPLKSMFVVLLSGLTVFSLLILSNETVVKDFIEIVKAAL
jgi:hypothetical protein